MRFIYWFLLSFIFYLNASAQEPKVLRIDPGFASGAPVSQVFEEIKYIPLETTKQSLFGTINRLEISEDYFIILDNSTNAILLFNKDGSFHAKISIKGSEVYSFKYEKEFRRIRVLTTNTQQLAVQVREKAETDSAGAIALLKRFIKVNYYTTDGKTLKVPAPEDVVTPEKFYSVTLPGGFSFSNFALAGEGMPSNTAFELNLSKGGKIYQSYFPYNKKEDIARYGRYLTGQGGFNPSQNDTIFYFTRPLDYSIYELTPLSLKEKYQVIFPLKNTVPQSFLTDKISQNDRRNFMRDNPSIITGLSDIYERKNRLFFKINNNERGRSRSTSMLYDLKTGRLIDINSLSPDSLSSFLPVFDGPFSYESFKASDERHLYTYISSLRMFGSLESNVSKNIPIPLELKEYFGKGDKKDNPIIIQLTPIINPS